MGSLGSGGVIHDYSFMERLEISRGSREQTDMDILCSWIDGCAGIVKTNLQQDKQGTDYIVTLRNGATVLIDAKTRETRRGGLVRFWSGGADSPDLALEKWSVVPCASCPKGKAGWTLCESKQVDLILFTFDSVDTNKAYLLPFQLLRMAYRRNLIAWHRAYRVQTQSTVLRGQRWQSQCVFVPAKIVVSAIGQVSQGLLKTIRADPTTQRAASHQLMFPPCQLL